MSSNLRGPPPPNSSSPIGEYENKGVMIIDEEEFLLILKLKDLKKQYRAEYQDLRDLRAEIQYCQHLVDQCRHRLLTGAPPGKNGSCPKSWEAQGHFWVQEMTSELLSGRGRPGRGFRCEGYGLGRWKMGDLCRDGNSVGTGTGSGTEGEPMTGSSRQQHTLAFASFISPYSSVSPYSFPFAEFDIWYNESFFIPEDIQMALRPGGNIRPGMVPLNRVVSLVSGTKAGVSPLNEHRAASTGLFSFISIHVEVQGLLPSLDRRVGRCWSPCLQGYDMVHC